MSDNLAAVLYGAEDLRVEKRTLEAPKEGQATVAVKSTGLCGSDVHYYVHGANGAFVLKSPMALGHESAGIVTAVGPGVTNVAVGDRVAIEAGESCKECSFCLKGKYNLCPHMRFCSSAKVFPHEDGTLQTALNRPARLLHKLPENVRYEQGALVEPLSVVMNAARRAGITGGQSVLVLGAGAVGLLGAAIAKAYGASYTVAVDISKERVDFAVADGIATAGHVLPLGPRPATPADSIEGAKKTAEAILAQHAAPRGLADGFDIVLECTGVESCMQSAIFCARPSGKVVYIGMGTINAYLPISAAAVREVDILGVFRYANTYPDAIKLFASGKLDGVEKLVTTRFPLEKSVEAFETVRKGKDANGNLVIKVMVGEY